MSSSVDSPSVVKKTPWLFRWPAAFFGPVLSALGAAAVPLSITQDSGLDPSIHWITDGLFFWLGLISLVVGIAWASAGVALRKSEADKLRAKLSKVESGIADQVSAARSRASADIVHQLSHIVHNLGSLIDSTKTDHGARLVDGCLHAVTHLIGVDDVRACLYYLDQVESDEASSTDILNALYVRMPQVGRQDPPRPEFIRGVGDHAAGIFGVIDTGVSRLVPDTANHDAPLDCGNKPYKTFMNVAVKFKTEEMGVLSIDAPEAGSLTENHRLLAEMLANILAIGMRREKRRNSSKNPSPLPATINSPVNPAVGGTT